MGEQTSFCGLFEVTIEEQAVETPEKPSEEQATGAQTRGFRSFEDTTYTYFVASYLFPQALIKYRYLVGRLSILY